MTYGRFCIRVYGAGRIHYARTEYYDTAVIIAESLAKHTQFHIQVWEGDVLKREDGKQYASRHDD